MNQNLFVLFLERVRQIPGKDVTNSWEAFPVEMSHSAGFARVDAFYDVTPCSSTPFQSESESKYNDSKTNPSA